MDFKLTEEQLEIKGAVREFCLKEFTKELAMECDREGRFPRELHRKAAQLGFVGIHMPEEYGGGGYGVLENVLVVEEMCRVDSTLGTAIMLSDLGCEIIQRYGTEEQKERCLPRITSGDAVSAVAITEPARGSAVSERLDTTATRGGDGWVINGTKTLITNAPVASFFITLCQTNPEAEPPYRGQSIFLVDRDASGVDVTPIEGKMGIRASPTGEVSFSDVEVPEGSLVGELNRGFYHVMEWFNTSRVEIAAQAVGIAQGALDRAVRYAKEREAFGRRIADFQAISHKLAEMATKVEVARLLTYRAAWLVDAGRADPLASSIAKTYAARAAVEVADEAVQVLGGYGYIGEYDVERYYRDAKITEIYEGTREIQKNTITRFMLKRS